MNNVPELHIGDGLSQASVQAQYQACGPAGTKLSTVTATYKAPRGERMVSVFLGTVPKDTPFDLCKLILKAGLNDTNQLATAMLRAGFTAADSARVANELLKMEDE